MGKSINNPFFDFDWKFMMNFYNLMRYFNDILTDHFKMQRYKNSLPLYARSVRLNRISRAPFEPVET